MPPETENRLTPAEAEMVLRRAAELSARRRSSDSLGVYSVSPEVLVQVATTIGIAEHDVRRALLDLFSDEPVEPYTLPRRLYGSARLRVIREIEKPVEATRAHIEDLLRRQGLKLHRKTEASSLWGTGDLLGPVRRALDFSGRHSLLKARSVELRVEDVGYGRSGANLTADVANQRGEYLSMGSILGATLALPLAIAGVDNWFYFLTVAPAFLIPGIGFKLAYKKVCGDARRAMDSLIDAAEEGSRNEEKPGEHPRQYKPGRIRPLNPIPKFTPQRKEE